MKKIFEFLAVTIFKIDTALYKTFGLVSTSRRQSWARCGRRLQADLDRQHSHRDLVNSLYGHNYTTKQALALED